MKKQIFLAILSVVSLSLCSCGNISDTASSSQTSELVSSAESSSETETIPQTTEEPKRAGGGWELDQAEMEAYKNEMLSSVIGNTKSTDFHDNISDDNFMYMFLNFTDTNNSLLLQDGVPENPVVLQPFKSILVD